MTQYIYGPTFEEMLDPSKISPDVRKKALAAVNAAPLDPINLYNITWKDAENRVRYVVLPKGLTGIDAEIVVLMGRFFPTGSHKVGATYSCTIERQAFGKIVPGKDRLVWPSTGNYGIGGAYVGPRMGYKSLVILPEKMSKERFEKISYYGADYIKTPGCESNVKEVYDKTHELEKEPNTIIVNQFADFGNYRFHYYVTGNTVVELFKSLNSTNSNRFSRLAAFCSAMGSGGTIAAGDRIKQAHRSSLVIGLEPVQCPTLYNNGFGDHDIQGIGDKHVTWVHNTDDMDAVICIDEWDCKKGLQLIAEEVGWGALEKYGVSSTEVEGMWDSFGISTICNILGAIKTAKYYKLDGGDVIFTVATDGLDRYFSVLEAMTREFGKMNEEEAEGRLVNIFHNQGTGWVREGDKLAKDCWANLKYYTWVEQQGKTVDELRAQRSKEYWLREQALVGEIDKRIREKRTS